MRPPRPLWLRPSRPGLAAAYYGAAKDSRAYAEAQKLYFFYGARHFEPIWLDQTANGQVAFSPPAQKILKLFKNAASEGLRPSDYLIPELDVTSAGNGPIKMAALETAFSRATMRYATHIYTGRIVSLLGQREPRRHPEKARRSEPFLVQLASSADPIKVLAALEPAHPEFLALKAALANFDQSQTDSPAQIAAGAILRPGMDDARVPALRQRFELADSADTPYDDRIVEAVKAFQQARKPDWLTASLDRPRWRPSTVARR